MNNNPIGILDSGVGGLSVERGIVKLLPNESTIYVGDTFNIPYGDKPPLEIFELSKRMIAFLLSYDVKIIVIACNTITISCIDLLRDTFSDIPIIGTVPVVKTVAELTKKKRVGIFSTKRTAESKYQRSLIEKFAQGIEVLNIGSNEIVPFIERGDVESEIFYSALKNALAPFQNADIDVLALGCTHYPFIEPHIREILGEQVLLLHSEDAIARQVKRVLIHNHILASDMRPMHRYFETGSQEKFEYFCRKVLKKKMAVQKVGLPVV